MTKNQINGGYNLNEIKYQILTVACVNILSFSNGNTLGWLSPSLGTLKSEETPLTEPLTVFEESWLGGLVNIGGIFGNLLFASLTYCIGPRTSIALLAIPIIMAALLLEYGTCVYYLYASRFLSGITGGGIFNCVPLFIADIADSHIRGAFGASVFVSMNFGILVVYIAGSYMPYSAVPFLILIFPIVFFCGIMFVPETPQYLLRNDKREEAKAAIKFYKNCKNICDNEKLNIEYEKIENLERDKKNLANQITVTDFCTPQAIRGLSIAAFLMILYVFNGSFVIIFYATNIFKDSGSEIDPNLSAIITMTIQVLGTCCATVLVDHVGRRLLLIISTTGSTLGLAIVGLYTFAFIHGINLTYLNWIPVTSISMVVFTNSIGVNALSFVIVAEVLPTNIRAAGSVLCVIFLSILLFTSTKLFPIISYLLEMYVCLWFFAFICAVGILFSVFVIKETKGKNLNVYNK